MQQFTYYTGGLQGAKQTILLSSDQMVIRSAKHGDGSRKDVQLPKSYQQFCEKRFDVPNKGVSVFDVLGNDPEVIRDQLRAQLPKSTKIAFAGRALQHPVSKQPTIYTENLYLRFGAGVKTLHQTQFLQRWKLEVKRKWEFAEGAYLIKLTEGTGTETFGIAESLLQYSELALCQPELLWQRTPKAIHAQQWHLVSGAASASVQEAHAISTGKGVCIAIIDDGVEMNHPEFRGKCVHPFNFVSRKPDGNPTAAIDAHGTNCAGVACAVGIQAAGVAPDALLMPLVIPSNTIGSMAEAEAIAWAADHGADVISCSWGPRDGSYLNTNDPLHKVTHAIPDFTRDAINYATTKGRGGKGCVITWAAGNGNESVDLDGYASHPDVLAIGACNEYSERSIYSDYGNALFCCFPSGDYQIAGKPKLKTSGLYVADRSGMRGRSAGDYTDSFSGTSAACPGVAGLVALLISVKPDFTVTQIRNQLILACDKIDSTNGKFDAQGHSKWYGFGRVNAQKLLGLDITAAHETIISIPTLCILEVCVAPKKGDSEYLIILNNSSIDHTSGIIITCGKKQIHTNILFKCREKRQILLPKSWLPNIKGTVTITDVAGALIDSVTWKKSELDSFGRKNNI
jgi:Subtilase family